MIYKGKKIF